LDRNYPDRHEESFCCRSKIVPITIIEVQQIAVNNNDSDGSVINMCDLHRVFLDGVAWFLMGIFLLVDFTWKKKVSKY